MSRTEKDRAIRTAESAIDKVINLVGKGFGGNETEQAINALRFLISRIENQ